MLLLMNLNTKEHKSHLFWLVVVDVVCQILTNYIICLLFFTISRLLALAMSNLLLLLLVIDNQISVLE